MELIKNWLAGKQNFIIGRTLYSKFGSDKNLISLFNKGETAFSKKKLTDALKALLDAPAKNPPPRNHEDQSLKNSMPESDDSVLKALRAQWLPLYQRMNMLRHKLDEYGTDNSSKAMAECKLLCDEILDLEQQCMVIWHRRNVYIRDGKLPEIKAEELQIPEDAAKLKTLIETTQRNIRRNKEKLERHPDRAHYADLIKKYEGQLEKIQSHINLKK